MGNMRPPTELIEMIRGAAGIAEALSTTKITQSTKDTRKRSSEREKDIKRDHTDAARNCSQASEKNS